MPNTETGKLVDWLHNQYFGEFILVDDVLTRKSSGNC